MRISDWSSDVCSSDLILRHGCGRPRPCCRDRAVSSPARARPPGEWCPSVPASWRVYGRRAGVVHRLRLERTLPSPLPPRGGMVALVALQLVGSPPAGAVVQRAFIIVEFDHTCFVHDPSPLHDFLYYTLRVWIEFV